MADVGAVLKDPNFHALPVEERRKVMLSLDQNFGSLPDAEQVKVLDHQPQQEGPPAATEKPGALSRFGTGVYESAIAPIVQTVSHPIDTAVGMAKQALGTDQLSEIQKHIGEGNYGAAASLLGKYAVEGPGGRMARGITDPIVNDVKEGNLAGAAGRVAGTAATFAGPKAVGKVAGKVRAVAETPVFKSTLNPVEQGAVDFLQEKNVPLNAGTVTGNQFLKSAQSVVQKQLLGARPAAQAKRATEAGLTRVAGELADQAHPTPVTRESAGKGVATALDQGINQFAWDSNEGYKSFRASVADPMNQRVVPGPHAGQTVDMPMPVYVGSLKEALVPVWEDMQWMPAADRNSSAGFTAVKKILEGPDYITAAQAEHGLGGIKSMARMEKSAKAGADVRNFNQGMGAHVTEMLQNEIDSSVEQIGGSSALKALQEGRAAHAGKMELVELGKTLREEPVQTFNQLLWGKDTGIDFLRRVAKEAPGEMPKVGRAFIQDLFHTATQEGGFNHAQRILNNWEQLGPETKKMLYPDAILRSNLDKFFKGAAMVADNPNPSGTAVVSYSVGGAVLAVTSPTTGIPVLLGGKVAAKLLFSPRGVALLTKGMKPKLSRLEATSTASEILKMAGKPVPETPKPVAVEPQAATPKPAVMPKGFDDAITPLPEPRPRIAGNRTDRRSTAAPPKKGASEIVYRVQDAREQLAQKLEGKSWSQITAAQRNTIDDLIREQRKVNGGRK